MAIVTKIARCDGWIYANVFANELRTQHEVQDVIDHLQLIKPFLAHQDSNPPVLQASTPQQMPRNINDRF